MGQVNLQLPLRCLVGILSMPQLGSEVAEADVAGLEPWSLHPAVFVHKGLKAGRAASSCLAPREPALPNLLLLGSWSGRTGTGPFPFSQLLNQGPSQKVDVFTLNKAQSPTAPPRKTAGFHGQSGDWQSPFHLKELLASTEAQPGL